MFKGKEELKKIEAWFRTLTKKEKVAVMEPHFRASLKDYSPGMMTLWRNTPDKTKLEIYNKSKDTFPTGKDFISEVAKNE